MGGSDKRGNIKPKKRKKVKKGTKRKRDDEFNEGGEKDEGVDEPDEYTGASLSLSLSLTLSFDI